MDSVRLAQDDVKSLIFTTTTTTTVERVNTQFGIH